MISLAVVLDPALDVFSSSSDSKIMWDLGSGNFVGIWILREWRVVR